MGVCSYFLYNVKGFLYLNYLNNLFGLISYSDITVFFMRQLSAVQNGRTYQ